MGVPLIFVSTATFSFSTSTSSEATILIGVPDNFVAIGVELIFSVTTSSAQTSSSWFTLCGAALILVDLGVEAIFSVASFSTSSSTSILATRIGPTAILPPTVFAVGLNSAWFKMSAI